MLLSHELMRLLCGFHVLRYLCDLYMSFLARVNNWDVGDVDDSEHKIRAKNNSTRLFGIQAFCKCSI